MQFVEYLTSQFGITKPEDWYNIKVADIVKNGGSGLLDKYNGSLVQMLNSLYPQYLQEDDLVKVTW
jgi:hypothetical protein